MLNKSISVENTPQMEQIFRRASDMANNWFSVKPIPNKETFCGFFQQHQLRCLRSRKLKSGYTRVSVVSKEGKEIFDYGENFTNAFNKVKLRVLNHKK